MPLPPIVEHWLLELTDAVFRRRIYPVPEPDRLRNCKIISHRGEHDNQVILENTMRAFEAAVEAGVWGIELDIRWTRDSEPVVFHDGDLLRLYGTGDPIQAFTMDGLKHEFPSIVHLSEIVSRLGERVHLMIEIKQQAWPGPGEQSRRLQQVLRPLSPVRDYHLLALQPRILLPFSRFPPETLVVVAEGWPAAHARWVLQNHWGGTCGHYLLMNRSILRKHHHIGRKIGTGYVRSRNCLFRELNRGVDWIFSNDAGHLIKIMDALAKVSR